jgi:CubicO group peptidase (beta-lactamase class C family)
MFRGPIPARFFAVAATFAVVGTPPLAAAADPALVTRLRELAASHYASTDAPGAAVLVVDDGETLLREGFGMADLEMGVAIAPEMVFRIGSITKQFTAVAILQQVAKGTLALDDPLTKFLPDYPTHGKTITVEHLLTHTSGIRSYTDMESFTGTMRRDMTPDEIIASFRDEPMEFDPGTKWHYNNSGYILLGKILEMVSGQSYEAYVEEHLFAPAGMTRSDYGSATRIVPGEVEGYTQEGDGWRNADYISMTLPYAAGSLLSTVDDLKRWNDAVLAGTLVSRDLLEKAFTSYRLADGSATHYGYGWATQEAGATRVIEHGGGINGFVTDSIMVPSEGVFVVVLTNREGRESNAEYVANLLLGEVLGKPRPKPVEMAAEALPVFEGVYLFPGDVRRTITVEEGRLVSNREGGSKIPLEPLGDDRFLFSESFDGYRFHRDAAGKVTGVTMERRYGGNEEGVLTDAAIVRRQAIALAPALLDRYPGRYELAPGFVLEVTRKDDQLWAQATGQPAFQLHPESETRFFLQEVDAQISFTLEGDVATALTLHQGGRDMPAKKLP